MLKVYYADVSELKITEKMLNCFSDLRLNKLQKAKDKQACAGAEALLCYALGKKPAYVYGNNGKPYFTDSDMCFNLSHSGQYVACALSDSSVGVDIQQIRSYRDNAARRVLTAEEYEFLQNSNDKEKLFCSLWAKKEALVKKSGGGIGELLSGVAETESALKELNGYALAVSGRGAAEFIEVSVKELTDFFEGME